LSTGLRYAAHTVQNRFNPRPIAAVRFVGRGWRFVDLSSLEGRGLIVRWEDDGR
jgi:hypothetical protein